MTKSQQEVVVGLILVAVAVAALLSIVAGSETAFESGRRAAMSSKTFPTILASGLGILSALFTIGAVSRAIADSRQGIRASENVLRDVFGRTFLVTVAVIVLLLAFAFLIKKVHFALLIFVFLFIGFYLFGQRRLALNAVVSAGGTAVFYGIFIVILQLPLNP